MQFGEGMAMLLAAAEAEAHAAAEPAGLGADAPDEEGAAAPGAEGVAGGVADAATDVNMLPPGSPAGSFGDGGAADAQHGGAARASTVGGLTTLASLSGVTYCERCILRSQHPPCAHTPCSSRDSSPRRTSFRDPHTTRPCCSSLPAVKGSVAAATQSCWLQAARTTVVAKQQHNIQLDGEGGFRSGMRDMVQGRPCAAAGQAARWQRRRRLSPGPSAPAARRRWPPPPSHPAPARTPAGP